MIRDKYTAEQIKSRSDHAIVISEGAERRSKRRDTFTYEKPIPPETLLRSTEDFSPILEIAFRAGITEAQSQRTLRTVERVHRAKAKEMMNWTAAMKRAAAAKHKAIKRIEEDMEVEHLRAHLKSVRSRLDEKNRDLTESGNFHKQIDVLRHSYEQQSGSIAQTPARSSREGDPSGASGKSGASTTKKQRLYNALHYSAIYDEMGGQQQRLSSPPGFSASSPINPRASNSSPDVCACCGVKGHVSTESIQLHLRDSSSTPLKVHEKYLQHQTMPGLQQQQQGFGRGGDRMDAGSSRSNDTPANYDRSRAYQSERTASPVRGTSSSAVTAESYVIEL